MRTPLLGVIVILCSLLTSCGESKESKEPGKTGTSSKASNEAKPEGGEGSEAAGNASSVEISDVAQRRVGLAVAPARVSPLAEVLTLTGTVQPLEGRITVVRPLTQGRLIELLVKVGDRVNRGQVVARFDNIEAGDLTSQYNAARAELARLRIQQALTAKQAERSRRLTAIGAVPQKELEAIDAERQGQQEAIRAQESTMAGLAARLRRFGFTDANDATTSTTTIEAPFSGVVTAVQAAPGGVVDSTSELLSIADLSRVYVAGQVYEKDLGRVRIGQNANILTASYPDVRFRGRVASLSPSLNPETRTASLRVEVANPAERLRIDMFATIEVLTAENRAALAVDSESIQKIEGKSVVFVRHDDTHFGMRPVQVGRVVGNAVEITGGLKEGDLVVTKGSFHLKSVLLGKDLGEKE